MASLDPTLSALREAVRFSPDNLPLRRHFAESLLGGGHPDEAEREFKGALSQWPDDVGLKQRFAVAALLSGQRVEGVKALDELIESKADDETVLTVGLLVLYDAFDSHQPIETAELDRARILRLADVYRGKGYASQALVDTWVATATGGKQ